MLGFRISSMTCGHCVSVVTQALKAVDADAKVAIDLPSNQVHVDTAAPRQTLVEALAEARGT